MLVNRLSRLDKIKFATWVANGQSLCGDAQKGYNRQVVLRPGKAIRKQKRRLGKPKRRQSIPRSRQGCAALEVGCGSTRPHSFLISGDETEARGSHGAGLAGHGVGKALALKRGRQVHFAAGEEACKKLHDHLQSVAQTGRLRLMEWGSSFAGADIGLCCVKLNRKSEALDMKSDIKCDKFGQNA